MSTFFYCLVLVGVTFMLGLIVGETYAPIGGTTTQALMQRASALDARLETLAARYDALSVEVREACGGRDAGL